MRMRAAALLVWMFVLAAFLAPAHARPTVTRLGSLDLDSAEKMKPNGEFIVYVHKDNAWEKAGSLPYDRFFREKEINLSSQLPVAGSQGEVRIRIVQKGGGAAHIDSVFLGAAAPREVKGVEDGLKKLSKKDFDVIDAFKKEMELAFPAKTKSRTLKLTARVEATEISKTPFQFPASNLYRDMSLHSEFYSYKLNSGDVDKSKPFFKEFSRTGSGHPSGFTYGWVRNDKDNLYVTIDFTPDNTMDGGKDYAKVYVKTGSGLKEFKVSVPETKWGTPQFRYTDRVSYQHKVYDFKIPFKEIGLNDARNAKELKLAFAAYGTAAPPINKDSPAIAHDFHNNRYLLVYRKGSGVDDIYGQLLNSDGTVYGSELSISASGAVEEQSPSVAYDSANRRFLVTWHDYRTDSRMVYGQLVNADGTPHDQNGDGIVDTDDNILISDGPGTGMNSSVAYDSTNKRFLVVWKDTSKADIYGRIVKADGSMYADGFRITNPADPFAWPNTWWQEYPSVAYDSANQRFLVVWQDNRDDTNFRDIYGQLVNADGSLRGVNFPISDDPPGSSQTYPSVAFDSVNRRFLVVWQDYRTDSSYDIYGQLVDANGNLFGSPNFAITSPDTVADVNPKIAYDSSSKRFLVVWVRNPGEGSGNIYGQLVSADGTLYAPVKEINTAPGDQLSPVVSYNYNTANFLVTYSDYFSSPPVNISLSLVGTPNTAPSAPALVYPYDNEADMGTALTFRFQKATDPDGDALKYYVYYSEDQSFATTTPITVASKGNVTYYAGLGGSAAGLLIFGLVLAGGGKKTRMLFLSAGLVAVSLTAISCGGGGGGGGGSASGSTPVTIRVGEAQPAAGRVAARTIPSLISTIKFKVSAAGMDTIEKTVSVTGDVVEETLAVPSGSQRLFDIFAYDSAGTLRYQGSTYADLSGNAVTLSIAMVVVTAADEGSSSVSGLKSGTTYYWKVVVEDSKGGRVESITRKFTTS